MKKLLGRRAALVASVFVFLMMFDSYTKELAAQPTTPLQTNTSSQPDSSSGISSGSFSSSGNQGQSSFYYLTGLLGTQDIALSGNIVYFNDSSDTDVAHEAGDPDEDEDGDGGNNGHGHGQGHGQGQGQNGNGFNGQNNQGSMHHQMKVTGSKWVSTDSTGTVLTNGSIDLHKKLIVKIYVTPSAPGHFLYYDMITLGDFGLVAPLVSDGAYLTVRDNNGVVWTSNGDQTGSSFVISSKGANMGPYTSFSGTFSVKMYDGQGNMQPFTNGNFTVLAGL